MRNKTIDFLRGIAIILTLFRHANIKSDFMLIQIGWIGVDLFFVLSGFLVSGLIFDEFKASGKFNGKLFLIRRGFKIYPAFWVMIVVSIIFKFIVHEDVGIKHVLSEFFFVQNYFHPMWSQTWSLAIEEHFYFFIVAAFIVIIKFFKNVQKSIIVLAILIILYGAVAKFFILFSDISSNFIYTDQQTSLPLGFKFMTHYRIDSLMYGLLIAYLYRYHKNLIDWLVSINYIKYTLWVIVFAGLSIPFLWSSDVYPQRMYLFRLGLTILSISFAILLILLLESKSFQKNCSAIIGTFNFNLISKIGFYSYSIYIWHILIKDLLFLIFERFNFEQLYIGNTIYFIFSILIGVFLAKLIEIPFLKIRDKFYPKMLK